MASGDPVTGTISAVAASATACFPTGTAVVDWKLKNTSATKTAYLGSSDVLSTTGYPLGPGEVVTSDMGPFGSGEVPDVFGQLYVRMGAADTATLKLLAVAR